MIKSRPSLSLSPLSRFAQRHNDDDPGKSRRQSKFFVARVISEREKMESRRDELSNSYLFFLV